MASFLLATQGLRGDIAPYFWIASRLQARGHRVQLAAPRGWQTTAHSMGVEFVALSEFAPDRAQMARVMAPFNGTEKLICEWILPALREDVAILHHAAQSADVLLSHTLCLAAPLVADLERSRLKWASSVVSPLALLTPDVALPAAPGLAGVPILNKNLLRILKRQFGAFLQPVKALRRELKVEPRTNALWDDAHSPFLQLCLWDEKWAWSRTRGRRIYCGFPAPPPVPGNLTPEIARFIDEGTPPLLFVAASGLQSEEFAAHSVAVAAILKRRALILGGPDLEMPGVLMRTFAPLQDVVGGCEALVSRGGIGTLAAGFRAGMPQVAIPHSHDQPDNARRGARLGLVRLARKLKMDALEEALTFAVSQRSFRVFCALNGPTLAAQNGADYAAQALHEFALEAHV